MQFGGFHYRSVMFPSSVEEEYQQIHQELTQSQVELQEARDRISGSNFCKYGEIPSKSCDYKLSMARGWTRVLMARRREPCPVFDPWGFDVSIKILPAAMENDGDITDKNGVLATKSGQNVWRPICTDEHHLPRPPILTRKPGCQGFDSQVVFGETQDFEIHVFLWTGYDWLIWPDIGHPFHVFHVCPFHNLSWLIPNTHHVRARGEHSEHSLPHRLEDVEVNCWALQKQSGWHSWPSFLKERSYAVTQFSRLTMKVDESSLFWLFGLFKNREAVHFFRQLSWHITILKLEQGTHPGHPWTVIKKCRAPNFCGRCVQVCLKIGYSQIPWFSLIHHFVE